MSVEAMPTGYPEFNVSFSNEDKEWVATTPAFPSLSWLDRTPDRAMAGLARLLKDVHADLVADAQETLQGALRSMVISDEAWGDVFFTDDDPDVLDR